jgi:hypothetical protein
MLLVPEEGKSVGKGCQGAKVEYMEGLAVGLLWCRGYILWVGPRGTVHLPHSD